MTVWFTLQLDDRPGSLARVATALAERNVNITGIVGVAEDTDGALMLTTSDAAADPRAAFDSLGLAYEEHDPMGGLMPDGCRDVQRAAVAAGRRGDERRPLTKPDATPETSAVRVDHIDRADAIPGSSAASQRPAGPSAR